MAAVLGAPGSVYFTVVPDTMLFVVVNTILLPTTFTVNTGLLKPEMGAVTVNAPGNGILVVLSGSL